MYTMDGRGVLTETELPYLRGYRGSVPVRIGNAALKQLQLDIYGELMDALYLSDKYGEQVSWQTWLGITRSMEWLAHKIASVRTKASGRSAAAGGSSCIRA
jgi:GH15 family glucan-1,4-alpha-glucosidase